MIRRDKARRDRVAVASGAKGPSGRKFLRGLARYGRGDLISTGRVAEWLKASGL